MTVTSFFIYTIKKYKLYGPLNIASYNYWHTIMLHIDCSIVALTDHTTWDSYNVLVSLTSYR